MENDEKRIMRPGSYLGGEKKVVQVIAYCIDEDTPIVILQSEGREIWMSDVLAEDVAKRITKALSILPTSK
jgi:hypothetical protein